MALFAVGLRRLAAIYLLAFLAAVATTPHRHLNSMEDLFSDEASDSGLFLERSRSPDPTGAPEWSSTRFRDDDPCLACFHHDFNSAAEAIAFLVLAPKFSPISLAPPLHAAPVPIAQTRSSRSRAPPAFA
jgi:hypothetical protein